MTLPEAAGLVLAFPVASFAVVVHAVMQRFYDIQEAGGGGIKAARLHFGAALKKHHEQL